MTNAGTISGNIGVDFEEGTGTVTNLGGIYGTAFGVILRSGGNVSNQIGGTISGGAVGVGIFGGAGTVVNNGAIGGTGTFTGVNISDGGAVKNQSRGTISGSGEGVYITGGAGTVTNAGTISGGTTSVEFAGSGANTLTLPNRHHAYRRCNRQHSRRRDQCPDPAGPWNGQQQFCQFHYAERDRRLDAGKQPKTFSGGASVAMGALYGHRHISTPQRST